MFSLLSVPARGKDGVSNNADGSRSCVGYIGRSCISMMLISIDYCFRERAAVVAGLWDMPGVVSIISENSSICPILLTAREAEGTLTREPVLAASPQGAAGREYQARTHRRSGAVFLCRAAEQALGDRTG